MKAKVWNIGELCVVLIMGTFATAMVYELAKSLFVHPDLFEVTPSEYGFLDIGRDYGKDNRVALVLLNIDTTSHREFLEDAKAANSKHKVRLASLNCGEYADSCVESKLSIRTGIVNFTKFEPHDDPEVLFFYENMPTDSYRNSLMDSSISAPTGRRQQVAMLLKWLDIADERAAARLKAFNDKEYGSYDDLGMGDMGRGRFGRRGRRRGYPGGMGGEEDWMKEMEGLGGMDHSDY